MKKIIMTGVVATSILAVSAFAYNNMGCNSNGGPGMGHKKHHMMNKGKGMMYSHHKGGMKFMRMFKQLNLTKEQRDEIRKIVQESMNKKDSMFSAFTADSFDKEKFIKQAMNKKENMIKLKAQVLEKAYDVLTKKQKSQLRVLMDLEEDKGFTFDRYCNGRG